MKSLRDFLYAIKSTETEIIGNWHFDRKEMKGGSECERIEFLVNNYLIFIAADESGWERLYKIRVIEDFGN